MESTSTQNRISVPALPQPKFGAPVAPRKTASALAFEIGAWLGGLEAFFENEELSTGAITDFTRPLLVSRSALQRASLLCFALMDELVAGRGAPEIELADVRQIHSAIRKPLGFCDPILAAGTLEKEGWTAWKSAALESLLESPAYAKLIAASKADGINFLPKKLRALLTTKLGGDDAYDFKAVLPRFGTILRILDLVGEMLERDEPLKGSLVIFAKVAERIRELLDNLNQRTERGGEDPEGLLGVFDASSYMISIELKKVMQQELVGVVGIRPATTIYARNETAYALLTEGFQHILAHFARHVDPKVDILDLFPSFKQKLDQSVILRRELYSLGEITREAERSTEVNRVDKLNAELNRFRGTCIRYLFYKDLETFERFVEEILANKNHKDLTALLHRFAAYVETLFGQVCLREVLEHHPFEIGKD